MIDADTIKFYDELVEHYGDKLANFEHHPIQFSRQIQLYRYYKAREENENSNLQ